MKNLNEALTAALALQLDPSKSTTPHCIEEYNAGITNAVNTIREAVEAGA